MFRTVRSCCWSLTSSKSRIATRPMSSSNIPRGKLRKQDFEYCVDLVQNRDRESYLCGLLLPSTARRSYFAIRAFNVELASIKDGSRQAMGAQGDEESAGPSVALKIRVQWWRDALGQIYGDAPADDKGGILSGLATSCWNNPVVRVLDHAVQESNLTRRFLERLLEAREEDLGTKQLDTVDEAVLYAESTFSNLFYLSLETTDVREDASDLVAYHAGIGLGLANALRAARFRLARGECSIPKELIPPQFPYSKLSVEDPTTELSEEEHTQLKASVRELLKVSSHHLSIARENQSDVPRHARACLLPVVPALHYLSRLEKSDCDIFDDSLLEPDQLRVLMLLGRTWLTGIF